MWVLCSVLFAPNLLNSSVHGSQVLHMLLMLMEVSFGPLIHLQFLNQLESLWWLSVSAALLQVSKTLEGLSLLCEVLGFYQVFI